MFQGRISPKSIFKSVDPVILFCMLSLSCMSLLTVIGGAEEFGSRRLIMQIAMNIVGIVATFFIARLDYRDIGDRFAVPFFFFSASSVTAKVLKASASVFSFRLSVGGFFVFSIFLFLKVFIFTGSGDIPLPIYRKHIKYPPFCKVVR